MSAEQEQPTTVPLTNNLYNSTEVMDYSRRCLRGRWYRGDGSIFTLVAHPSGGDINLFRLSGTVDNAHLTGLTDDDRDRIIARITTVLNQNTDSILIGY